MKYATNGKDRVSPEDGQTYDPGKFVFVPQVDGTLRHVVGFEGRLYDGEPSVAFSNAELDEWLARKPVGTVELTEAVHEALAVALTGTGSITLSLFGKATRAA